MKILVTGGAGFIGSNLVEKLLEKGHEVCVYDDLSTGYRQNLLGFDIEFVHETILNKNLLESKAKSCDSIIHLAALGSVPRSIKDPLKTHLVNVEGTLNVLEVARKFKLYTIFSSSSSVYGPTPTQVKHEELPINPVSPYAASKVSGEAYFRAYMNSFDLPGIIFRFFNVFGPKQSANHPYAAVLPNFISAILNNNPIPVEGDGTQTRDFTYVDSVVDTLISTINNKVISARPINLAVGISTSLLEAINILQDLSDKNLKIKYLPRRLGDINNSRSDPTLYNSMFPFIAHTTFKDALSKTYNWYKTKN